MGGRRRRLAVLLSGAIVAGAFMGAPRAEAAPQVVVVDQVVVTLAEEGCSYQNWDYRCHQRWQGAGISVDGARAWTVDFEWTWRSTHLCVGGHYTGTWSLVAADAGLFGTLADPYSPFSNWIVTGGTGAYAGATSANPAGNDQGIFYRPALPPELGLTTQPCRGQVATPLPIAGGTLRLDLA